MHTCTQLHANDTRMLQSNHTSPQITGVVLHDLLLYTTSAPRRCLDFSIAALNAPGYGPPFPLLLGYIFVTKKMGR